jgi:putative addiction module killer protein
VFELLRYQAADGSEPFSDWLRSIGDVRAQARIRLRLRRLEAGLFGDCKSVGEGVLELRDHEGAGHRVYLGRHGRMVVILLYGGTKRTQARDIEEAKKYWADWKRRQA